MNPDYSEYESLSEYHKRCLACTNFWRVVNNQQPIQVPHSDQEYWKQWDGYYRSKAEELRIERNAWLARQ
jgi:hypothetical protein